MLTRDQKETFQDQGLLRLEAFLPAERVGCARDVLLQHFEGQGLWQEGNWQMDALPPSTSPAAGAALIKGGVKQAHSLKELITPELLAVVGELLDGRPMFPMMDAPQILFTLPNAEAWTVPAALWHVDIPRLPDKSAPGVQMFTFLDRVVPGGGGTLAVTGSHRLLNEGRRLPSKTIKCRLKREPYFRDLMSYETIDRARFLREPGSVGDVELKVVEMYGEPGDVYLMDIRMLHAIAPNAARVPRMMLTQRFLISVAHAEIFRVENADNAPA